jgi:hypothetical protein
MMNKEINMTKRIDYDTINQAMNRMVDATRADYGSFAFAAGVFQNQLAYAVSNMTAQEQKNVLSVINSLADQSEEKLYRLEQQKQFEMMSREELV